MRLVERCDTGYRPRSYYRGANKGNGFRMPLQVAHTGELLFCELDVTCGTVLCPAMKAVMERWKWVHVLTNNFEPACGADRAHRGSRWFAGVSELLHDVSK